MEAESPMKPHHIITALVVTALAGAGLWLLRPSGPPLIPAAQLDGPTQALVCTHYRLVTGAMLPGECRPI